METDLILEKAASLKAAHKPFALVTVVRAESPTSAKPGAKAIIEPEGDIQGWIGGGCAQPAVLKTARDALNDGQPRLIRISPDSREVGEGGVIARDIINFSSSCHSGGTLDIFIEPIIEQSTLLIIGSSPIAETLCALASRVGFSVIVASRNTNFEQFPDAHRLISEQDLDEIELNILPFVVVSTQGKRDEAGLVAALDSGATYIAFIASERKASKLREKLKQRGIDPLRVDAIIAPAGIDINATTPNEIALSILAALVKERRSIKHSKKNKPEKNIKTTVINDTSDSKAGCCHAEASSQ